MYLINANKENDVSGIRCAKRNRGEMKKKAMRFCYCSSSHYESEDVRCPSLNAVTRATPELFVLMYHSLWVAEYDGFDVATMIEMFQSLMMSLHDASFPPKVRLFLPVFNDCVTCIA